MSYIKVYPESAGRGETRLNQEKITTDKNGNTFKPKINIQLGTAGKGSEIRLVSVTKKEDKNLRAVGAGNQTAQRVVLVNHDVQKESASVSLPEDGCDSDPDCKIERKPSKKVSALISQFNKAVVNVRPPRKDSDPQIPTKRLKTDVNSVLQSRAEALANQMETDSEESGFKRAEIVSNVQSGYVQLPNEVCLNFKLHREEKPNGTVGVNHVKISEIQCNAACEDDLGGKEVLIAKSKPAVKPRTHTHVAGSSSENPPKAVEGSEIRESDVSHYRQLTKTVSVVGSATIVTSASVNRSTIYVNKSSKGDDVSQHENNLVDGDVNGSDNSPLLVRHNVETDENVRTSVVVTRNGADVNRNIVTQSSASKQMKIPEETLVMQTQPASTSETKISSNPPSSKREDENGACDPVFVSTGSDVKNVEPLSSHYSQQQTFTVNRSDNVSKKETLFENNEVFLPDKTAEQTETAEDSGAGEAGCSKTEYSKASDRINNALNTLKSELMALREQDLALLKQLINISQNIQLMQRSRVLRVSKSLSFSNVHLVPTKPLQRRYRPVERQNSAPHTVERKRMLFSNLRASTEDEIGGSLSSFEDSEFDSQSELEESTSSLNSIFPNSPKSPRQRTLFQSRAPDVTLSLDVAEDTDQTYEDILRRNVRLWKMSLQKQESVIEEVACLL